VSDEAVYSAEETHREGWKGQLRGSHI